jgi:hypothetical protein
MSLTVIIPFARFPLGKLCITPGADAALHQSGVSLTDLLTRHATGDWGVLDPADRQTNEMALQNGLRLLSSYRLANGQTLWIITEADRSATTALFPDEY